MSLFAMIKKAIDKPKAESKVIINLKEEDFSLDIVSRIGTAPQSTGVAYDPVQKLLAVSCATGSIHIYGRHSLEKQLQCPNKSPIVFVYWIVNSGRLVTVSQDGSVYRWAIWNDYPPRLIAFMSCHATATDFPTGSKFLYIGDHLGTVSICNVEDEHVSAYKIKSDAARGNGDKCVVSSLALNPADERQILICYNDGVIVVWDLLMKKPLRTFTSSVGVSTCSWHGHGQKFLTGHVDGSLRLWRVGKDPPQHVFYVAPSAPCRPVRMVEWYGPTNLSDLGNLYVAGGEQVESDTLGFSILKDSGSGNDKKLFDCRTFVPVDSGVLAFSMFCQSPWKHAERKEPFGVAILTERRNALVYNYSYAGSPGITLSHLVQKSVVTAMEFHSMVGKDFVNDLTMTLSDWQQSLRAKYWPLNGGRFSRIPSLSLSGSLLVTGHANGEVRIWDATERGNLPSAFLTTSLALLGLPADQEPPKILPKITGVALCPTARILAIGTVGGHLGVLMFRGGDILHDSGPDNESKKSGGFELKFKVEGHSGPVHHVQIVSGLHRLAAVDDSAVLTISETMQGMCLLRQKVFENERVSYMRVIDQEPAVLLYVGSEAGTIISYDLGSCSPVISLRFPDSSPLVSVGVLSTDGKLMSAPSPSEWFDIGEMEALDERHRNRAEADGNKSESDHGDREDDEVAPHAVAPQVPSTEDEMAGSERAAVLGGSEAAMGSSEQSTAEPIVEETPSPAEVAQKELVEKETDALGPAETPENKAEQPVEEKNEPMHDPSKDADTSAGAAKDHAQAPSSDGNAPQDDVPAAGAASSTAAKPLLEYTTDEVADWLATCNLHHPSRLFRENDISGDLLPDLTMDMLKNDIGVKRAGERMRVLTLIRKELGAVHDGEEKDATPSSGPTVGDATAPKTKGNEAPDKITPLPVMAAPPTASPSKSARSFSTSVSPQLLVVVSENLVVVAQLPSAKIMSKFTLDSKIVSAEVAEVKDQPCLLLVDEGGMVTVLVLPALVMVTSRDLKQTGTILNSSLLKHTCISADGNIVFLSAAGELNVATMFGAPPSNTTPKKFFLDGLEMPQRPTCPTMDDGFFKKLFQSSQISPQVQAEQLEELLGKPTPEPTLKVGGSSSKLDAQSEADAKRKEIQKEAGTARENLEQAKESLVERGEKLSNLANKTNDLSDQADKFLSDIRAYNQRQESKKWWQL